MVVVVVVVVVVVAVVIVVAISLSSGGRTDLMAIMFIFVSRKKHNHSSFN